MGLLFPVRKGWSIVDGTASSGDEEERVWRRNEDNGGVSVSMYKEIAETTGRNLYPLRL